MRGTAASGSLTLRPPAWVASFLGLAVVVPVLACRPVGAPPPAPGPGSPLPVEAPAPSAPGATPRGAVEAPAPSAVCPQNRLQTVLDAVNLVRTDRGLRPLRPEPRLVAAAETHARDLARHRLRGHEGSDRSLPPERATTAGYPWILVGENVATGFTSPSTVVSGWMASPPHREILLNPDFREAGIGWNEGDPAVGPVWVLVVGRRRAAPDGPPGCTG